MSFSRGSLRTTRSVERFEQLSTPLEDIFVGVVERAAGIA